MARALDDYAYNAGLSTSYTSSFQADLGYGDEDGAAAGGPGMSAPDAKPRILLMGLRRFVFPFFFFFFSPSIFFNPLPPLPRVRALEQERQKLHPEGGVPQDVAQRDALP